jgi:hypothetical protein
MWHNGYRTSELRTLEVKGKRAVSKSLCSTCHEPIYPGIAHVCPALRVPAAVKTTNGDDGGLRGFLWKIAASLLVALILQLLGAIWWASKVEATIQNFQQQISDQKATIERIDSYFRRPPAP